MLNSYAQGDSLKIYQAIAKGTTEYNRVTAAVDKLYNETFKLAEENGNPKWEYDVLFQFGFKFKESNPNWALDRLIKAQALATASAELKSSKLLLFTIGQLYQYHKKNYELASSNYLLCEELIDQQGNPTLPELYFELIRVNIQLEHKELVAQYLEKSWSYAEQANNHQLLLQTAGLQLEFDKNNQDYKSIIKNSERILSYISSDGGFRIQYSLQGSAYRSLNDFENAITAYNKALSYTSDGAHYYQIYLDMAVCRQKSGEVLLAIEKYNQAIESTDDTEKKARAYLFLARTYYTFRLSDKLATPIKQARDENNAGRNQAVKLGKIKQMILDTMYYDTQYLIEKYEGNLELAEQARDEKYKLVGLINAHFAAQKEERIRSAVIEKTKKQEIEKQAEERAKELALLDAENEKTRRRIEVAEEAAARKTAEIAAQKARAEEAIARREQAEAREKQIKAQLETAIAKKAQDEAEKSALKSRAEASEAENRAKTADLKIAHAQMLEKEAKDKEKEERIKVKNQQYMLLGLLFIMVLGAFFYHRNHKQKKVIEKNKIVIEQEKERSENLLLSILPQSITDELKMNQSVQPQHYDQVSVLFSDFKGFTRISEKLSPTELLRLLNTFFALFDEIASEHNLERIKTIGDAYMAAGGLPQKNVTNAIDAVAAGLAIQKALHDAKKKLNIKQEDWQMRVGVHTGPVVAGVVGTTKFAYDIWGDAVNVASRLESNSEAGQVNVSRDTYELIKDHFECQYRGEIEIKNRGKIEMYFVLHAK